ncbi:MAG: thymidine phosphorylase [Acidobacteria bacterium]|nr:MAG: thymidine phosphorylase [Acidobacteriota bacterium]
MRPQDIIAIKRDGGELSDELIGKFVDGVCDKSWADYQISALVMAMFIRGLSTREGETLVREMLNSGEILDFSEIAMPKADKHSTGGVGDKTSLIIAPLVASCGVAVPMVSGRGLGHTGGTLDKLESIPGYNVRLSTSEFHAIVGKCGFAMTGQTAEIAPADKKLYALRDATATVPYIPLIVASIMSKKLAEGLDVLVLDVKTGSGAFMESEKDAAELARAMVATGERFNVKTQAVISDMSQPLGKYVGNAVEVYECIKILRNEIEPAAEPTWELSLELSARMLVLADVESDLDSARQLCVSKIKSGEALERFCRNIECQSGDPTVCDDPDKLLDPNITTISIKAGKEGVVTAVDTLAIGNAVSEIGGGRVKADETIDHAVGFASDIKIGDRIDAGGELGRLYVRNEEQASSVSPRFVSAYSVDACLDIKRPDLIRNVIG